MGGRDGDEVLKSVEWNKIEWFKTEMKGRFVDI